MYVGAVDYGDKLTDYRQVPCTLLDLDVGRWNS